MRVVSETSTTPAKSRRAGVWIAVAIIAVLLAAGIAWAVLAQRDESPGVEGAAVTLPASVTPQPTQFATPTPGATESVDKPAGGEEVPVGDPAPAIEGAVVQVTAVEAVQAGGDRPGEPEGPAVMVTVRITNGGSAPLSTAGSSVNLMYGGDDALPGVGVSGGQSQPWPDSIAAGAEATGVFVFATPVAAEGDIRVTVDLLASAPDVVFVGPRP